MQKYGNLGNLPPTKREVTAAACPMGCGRAAIVMTSRPPGLVGLWWSRCIRCLCYWETNAAGEVVLIRVVEQKELCPHCYGPDTTTGHVCTKT